MQNAPGNAPDSTDVDRPLFDLTIVEARALFASGRMTATAYHSALRQRAESVAGYNTMVTSLEAPEIAQPGPLQHIPIVVKDNIDVARIPTTAGTASLLDNIAPHDAVIVERLLGAGAYIAGKNVMHELALGATTNNALHGGTHNPWRRGATAGGSSGGTASAVALGIAPAGIGTDTGGSVRVPASLCGIFGFRPSVGRYPSNGIVPLSPTRDTAGPLARSIEDVALLDAVLSGRPRIGSAATVHGLRLGVTPSHFADLAPDVADASCAVRELLGAAGVDFVNIDLDDLVAEASEIAASLVWGEARTVLTQYMKARGAPSLDTVLLSIRSPDVAQVISNGIDSVTAEQYRQALAIRRRLRSALSVRIDRAGTDALFFPTTPLVAPPLGEDRTIEHNGRQVPTFSTIIRHADMGGILDMPGISLPIGLGQSSRLPVGIELSVAPGQDDRVLALAGAIAPLVVEQYRPSDIPLDSF